MRMWYVPSLCPNLVQGAEFRVEGAGCRVQGAGCRVQGAGFRGHESREHTYARI